MSSNNKLKKNEKNLPLLNTKTSSIDHEYQGVVELLPMEVENTRRKSSLASPLSNIIMFNEPGNNGLAACAHYYFGSNLDMSNETNSQIHELSGSDSSRVITKTQLLDTPHSIRRLARQLSYMRLRLRLQNLLLLVKPNDSDLLPHARELARWLLLHQSRCYNVYIEDKYADDPQFDAAGLLQSNPSFENRLRFWDAKMCIESPLTFDLIIALGGDGTVLYASWLFQQIVPPVLAFCMGSLGFLTQFNFENYRTTFERVENEGVSLRLRLRLEVSVMRSVKEFDENGSMKKRDIVDELIMEAMSDKITHKLDRTRQILNDIVIDRGPNATMSTLELFGNNAYYTTVQADGLCVSTPTGSTAYNLAAGGSLCHPDNPVILVTAICAHTLSFRPIILPDLITLRIAVSYDSRCNSWVSFDGKEHTELFPGDYVTIVASRYPFPKIISPKRGQDDWINSIRRTLHWNTRKRQKPWSNEQVKD